MSNEDPMGLSYTVPEYTVVPSAKPHSGKLALAVFLSLIGCVICLAWIVFFQPFGNILDTWVKAFGGSTHLELEADTSALAQHEIAPALQRTQEILIKRLQDSQVWGKSVKLQGNNRLQVDLLGVKDSKQVKDLLTKPSRLSFYFVATDTAKARQAFEQIDQTPDAFDENGNLNSQIAALVPAGFKILKSQDREYELVEDQPLISENDLERVSLITNDATTNYPQIDLLFTAKGGRKLGEYTAQNIGRRLAIAVDNIIIMSPIVQERIEKAARISGVFTKQEAQALVIALNAGTLPVPVKIIN